MQYYCAGSVSAVVFLHGLGGAGVVWYRNLPALAGHYDMIAPDLWGPWRYQDRR